MNTNSTVKTTHLTPLIHPIIRDITSNRDFLIQAKYLHNGPVHVIVPEIMDENIQRFKKVFNDLGVEVRICYAHKPNKSSVFVRQAQKNSINIDVASKQELISALASGYAGNMISCTGPKNGEFLTLAIQHQCLISIDSLMELQMIIDINSRLKKKISALLRIENPMHKDRHQTPRLSRFGIPQENLPELYTLMKAYDIVLAGFHFHNDERTGNAQAGNVENMLQLIEQAHRSGFSPTIIDIGGGFRSHQLESPEEWPQLLDHIEQNLILKQPTNTWKDSALGMRLNVRGTISGREKIQGKYSTDDFEHFLKDVFEDTSLRGRRLGDVITESMCTIVVEPGFALLQNCGVTLVDVIGVKKTSTSENLILVNGNMHNLSTQMTSLLTDPIVLRKDGGERLPDSGYLVGNLCREEDILIKRKIFFDTMPQTGDVLCFINTAAYTSDFEDARPHQHPLGMKIVACKDNGRWILQSENVYNPFKK